MSDTPDSFWATLQREIRLTDCLALAVVPAVLVAVFLLPLETRMEFAFVYRRPTGLTAYTAHFVHRSLAHLLANLGGYVLLAGSGYVLAVLADARRLFGLAVVTYLLAFPPVLSALNLAIPRNAVGYGFSGVTMAFAGLLPVILAAYAARRLHPRVGVQHAPAGFLALVAVVALVVPIPGWILPTTAVVATIGAAGFGLAAVRALRSTGLYVTARKPGWVDAFVLGVVVFVGYPFIGFPTEPSTAAGVVNTYVHLLGFCLAFLVAYVAVLFDITAVPDE